MEPPSSHCITVINETDRVIRTNRLKVAVSTALKMHGKAGLGACILLTTDDQIQDLNRTYRGIDESTDVLTFIAGDFAGDTLGDIAISVPYAQRQSTARRVSLAQELGFLAIHGALHLVGFDDQTESERAEMVRQMNLVAMEVGLKPDTEWASILHGELA